MKVYTTSEDEQENVLSNTSLTWKPNWQRNWKKESSDVRIDDKCYV